MTTSNPFAPPHDEARTPPSEAAAGEALTVVFELDERDVVAFHHMHYRRVGGATRWLMAGFGALLWLGGALQLGSEALWLPLLLFALGSVLALLGMWLGSRAQLARSVAGALKQGRRLADLGSWHIEVKESGVSFTTPTKDCRFAWQCFERVLSDSDYIFLYTSPVTALIVPKRALGSAQRAAHLMELAARSIQLDRARRGEPPIKDENPSLAPRTLLVWLLVVLLFALIYFLIAPEL